MSLINLHHRLYESRFLKRLLQADKHKFDPPSDMKDIKWEVLPYYLPSAHPRITFHLYTTEGEFLLKLNTEIHKIHREAAACQQLHQFNIPELSVPLVYAVETQVPLSQNQYCGWLITDWVNGMPAARTDDEILVNLLPPGLLNLHRLPVNDIAVEPIFEIHMPRHAKAQELLRERRIEYFEYALQVCTKKLVRGVRQLKEMVCAHLFTGHLAFIHGDLHINNIKYYQEANKDGHRLFLFDWEDISIDHPLYDLANLMFSDGFSERSQKCLEIYVSLYNQNRTEQAPLNLLDAWMLTVICFVRNLRWNLIEFRNDQQMLERRAEKTIEKIVCIMNKKMIS